jgi:hypothetical protein
MLLTLPWHLEAANIINAETPACTLLDRVHAAMEATEACLQSKDDPKTTTASNHHKQCAVPGSLQHGG